jgi:hypothetical protein
METEMADECSPETAVPFSDEFVAWRHRFVQFLRWYIWSPDPIQKDEACRTWSFILQFIMQAGFPRWEMLLELNGISDKELTTWLAGNRMPSLQLRRSVVRHLAKSAVKKFEVAERLKISSANDNGL